MGKLLLRQARFMASAPYIGPYDGLPVDHVSNERRRAYIL